MTILLLRREIELFSRLLCGRPSNLTQRESYNCPIADCNKGCWLVLMELSFDIAEFHIDVTISWRYHGGPVLQNVKHISYTEVILMEINAGLMTCTLYTIESVWLGYGIININYTRIRLQYWEIYISLCEFQWQTCPQLDVTRPSPWVFVCRDPLDTTAPCMTSATVLTIAKPLRCYAMNN